MLCDIARNLDAARLEKIQALERDLNVTIVAFSCRTLDPAREERLKKIMDEIGPILNAEPADPDEAQLERIRATEADLGLSLVAVRS